MKRNTKWWSFTAITLGLCLTVIFGCRCTTSTPAPDPLAGWKLDLKEQPNAAITKDYQDYIRKLPPEEKKFAALGQFLEDGTGQHAIVIGIALNGTDWSHVLFYDKQNKRIRVVKYISGHYRS